MVRGEQRFVVQPLETPAPSTHPDAATVEGSPAVILFVERARAVDPAFRLTDANAAAVAELCRRLDGLPLAIELLASRASLLPPEALLTWLSTGLGLLEGGAPDAPGRQQTMRGAIVWGYDLLTEDRKALFRRLLVFEGGCRSHVRRTGRIARRPRRSLLAGGREPPQAGDGAGRRAAPENAGGNPRTRARTPRRERRGRRDAASALSRFEESLDLYCKVGYGRGRAYALANLEFLALESGDAERAQALQEQSLDLYQELKDMAGRAYALTNLADAVDELGDKVRATALYEEALALQRELGNERGAARALARLTASR
jgi:tetratricopeptide (TPR) repeat protein